MRIDVEIDTTGLDVRIGSVARNLAYAATQAINDVAGDIRTKGRGEISNLMRKVRLKGNNNFGPSAFEQASGEAEEGGWRSRPGGVAMRLTKEEAAMIRAKRKRFQGSVSAGITLRLGLSARSSGDRGSARLGSATSVGSPLSQGCGKAGSSLPWARLGTGGHSLRSRHLRSGRRDRPMPGWTGMVL